MKKEIVTNFTNCHGHADEMSKNYSFKLIGYTFGKELNNLPRLN